MTNVYSLKNTMMEPDNFAGSEFITEHYQDLLRYVTKILGSDEHAVDLLNDVFISIRTDENNNEGYSPDGSRHIENYSVRQWVQSRICAYSKNERYHGKIKHEVNVGMEAGHEGDGETMSAVQAAYFYAPSTDDLELIDMECSVREEVEYLISLDGHNNISLKWVLNNISSLMENTVDSSVFQGIRELGSEALEALRDVLTYAMANPESYKEVLAAAC